MNLSLLSVVEHPRFAPVRAMLRRILPHGIRHSVHARAMEKYKERRKDGALTGERANLDDIARLCCADAVPVKVPLVMISQIQRSGGTLLSQLFDNHSQVLAHPQELKIGYPEKFNWPPVEVGMEAERMFDFLFERTNVELVEQGYSKGNRDAQRYRFFLPPFVQRQIFLSECAKRPPAGARDIFDAYFTSYFNAWLNYRGAIADARCISAFVPRMAHDAENMRRFFEAYPDGRLISILREPASWFASAKRHSKQDMFAEVGNAMGYWREGAQSIVRNRKLYGDKVIVLAFESLAGDTEGTMRWLSGKLGLDFTPSLLEPTFNGAPIGANSSFEGVGAGIVKDVVTRGQHIEPAEREYIERHADADYQQARSLVDR